MDASATCTNKTDLCTRGKKEEGKLRITCSVEVYLKWDIREMWQYYRDHFSISLLFEMYIELTGEEAQPDVVPDVVRLRVRQLSSSYFRAGNNTTKQYHQPLGSYRQVIFYSGVAGGAATRGASWVRKYGNPSMREILVKASGMARGRVRLRRTAYVSPDDIFTWSNVRSARPCLLAVWKVFSTSDTIAWNWVLNRFLWLKGHGNPVITSMGL